MIGAYIFNEKVAGRIYDFSGNHFDLNTLSNIGYSSALTDGYDAVFGVSAISYGTSSTFSISSTQQNLSLCLKLKCASAPVSSFVLLNLANTFKININSSGFIVFTFHGLVGTTPTTFTKTSSVNVCDGNYHSIICVANGATLQIYTDGLPESSATTAVYSVIALAGSTLIIGSDTTISSVYYQGGLSYVIISQNALSFNDAAALANSPQKGINFETQGNSFQIGDLLTDPTNTVQCVVIWSPDTVNVNVLPLSAFQEAPLYKIGNIYQPMRQYYQADINDFDGNGNAQRTIAGPITSLADYANPKRQWTLDYRGVQNIPGTGLTWIMESQARSNQAGIATNAYTDILDSFMLGTEGDYATFKYIVNVVNTGGTIKIIFEGTTLFTFTPSTPGIYQFTGDIVAQAIKDGSTNIYYTLPGANPVLVTKTVNFGSQNKLILQLNSASTGDLIALRGSGIVYNSNISN